MEKLTLFELHFDGAQFGTTTMSGEESEHHDDAEEPVGESGSGRLLRLIAASVVLSVVATAIARRLARSDADLELDDDTEDIAIEPVEAE